MTNRTLIIIAAVALIALLALLYIGSDSDEPVPAVTETSEAPPPLPPPRSLDLPPEPAPPQEPEPAPEPVIVEPQPEQVAEAPAPPAADEAVPEADPLPRLDASDDYVLDRIAELERGPELLRLLINEEVVRKFVIFTENVSRGVIPQNELPVRPVRTPLQVRELNDDNYVMEPETYARFDAILDTLLAVDADRAMEIYAGIKPLLQEAYAEMGYPGRDFNEVLARAIDRVLNAELPEGPFLLNRPSVMYKFADEDVENLSAVQKQLLRLGPENTRRLRDKLRELRERLAVE